MPSAMFVNKSCSIFSLLLFSCPIRSAPYPQNSDAVSALFSIIRVISVLVFSECEMMIFCFG